MITRINSVEIRNFKKQNAINSDRKNASNIINQTSVMSLNSANAIKAINNISFKGDNLEEFEQSFILANEIRIPNLLDLNQDIHIPWEKMPKNQRVLNTAGLNVHIDEDYNFKKIKVTNDLNDTIFVGKLDKNLPQMPIITYKQGKFMPEVTIKDPSLKDKKIKMFAGSEIIGNGIELKMPGTFEPIAGKDRKTVSFMGRAVITTLNKEERTRNAVNKYLDADLASQAIKGDYADLVEKYDPTIIIPAGGFGERFRNITRDKENKPSAKMPTNDNYRIIGTTLNLAASAGIIKGGWLDDIKYLSQKHEIKGDNVYDVDTYKTDGGAIAEGLARDIIRNDKDVIILNADIFTNADITRVYQKLKTLPDAGLVIPYYPVNPKRAKSFGLLGIEKDDNGNLQIKKFMEKPKYTSAPLPNDFRGTDHGEYENAMAEYAMVKTAQLPGKDNVYLANPGFYFLSKEAAKVLTASGIMDSKLTGLGGSVMPKIVEMANEGKLKDTQGRQLKVYTVPLEAKDGKPAVWDDIGTAEAYLRLIKDVAYETKTHGSSFNNKYYGVPEFVLKDFEKNVDLTTGIVYGCEKSKEAMNSFKEKYNISTAQGNIFVTID